MFEARPVTALLPAAAARPPSARVAVLALAIAVAVLAAFAPVVRNGFVNYDDDTSLYRNPRVQQGFTAEAVRWAFTTTESRNWHPLTWLSHMLDFSLFGDRAGGHHAVSALLHAANAALLFALLYAMTGAFWRSALVAAIFGLHPLRVESVAWAAERKDVLSLLFGLLTAAVWLRFARRRFAGNYAAALALFACALMSKAMLVTLPAILLLLDLWPLGRWPREGARRLVLEKVPFVALAAAVAIVTYRAQDSGGAVGYAVQFPLAGRVGNAVTAYGAYLAKTVWPAKLAVLYPYAWEQVPLWQPVAGAVLLAAVTVAALLALRRRPVYFVGWAWYLGTLVPVIGLVQAGSQSMADRYTYLPQVGVLLMLCWGLADLVRARPGARRAVVAVLAIALPALAVATWVNAGFWRSSETLFTHALSVTRNNYIAMSNLGVALSEIPGREAEGKALIGKALKLSPDFRAAPYERGGDFYASNGMLREAAGMYRQALELVPYNETIRGKLRALDDVHVGPAAAPAAAPTAAPVGQHPAEPEPADPVARGNARVRAGRLEEAIFSYQEALRADPRNASAWHNLGCAYADLRLLDEAEAAFGEALRLKPDHQGARDNLEKIREVRAAGANKP